jgi:hypothetical protein
METPATPLLADKMAALSVRAPKEKKVKEAKEAAPKAAAGGKDVKKETQLGLSVTREQDFGAWYSQASVQQRAVRSRLRRSRRASLPRWSPPAR